MLHKYDPKSIWHLDRTRMRRNSIFDRLTALYFRKRSEVQTREGEVVYRRRIFRYFGLRQTSFIEYHIHSINDIDDDIDQSYWISGKITAVYLLADGQTFHHSKKVKHVSLPKVFTNMVKIRNSLESLHNSTT